ncbi:MAG: hypothetical protein AABZ06_04920 [Bdellovibrionota bacterium]
MKTITEFGSITLKEVAKKKNELTTSGKTPEEISQEISTVFKLDGNKLKLIMNSLDVIGTKLNDLKRVVVLSLSENEKPPTGAVPKEEYYFRAEYYPPLVENKKRHQKFDRPFKGKGRSKKTRRPQRGQGKSEDKSAQSITTNTTKGAPTPNIAK